MKKGSVILFVSAAFFILFSSVMIYAWPDACVQPNDFLINIGESGRCSSIVFDDGHTFSGQIHAFECLSSPTYNYCGSWYCDSQGGYDTYVCCKTNATQVVYLDKDHDRYYTSTSHTCQKPSEGWTIGPVKGSGDCDDNNRLIKPGAIEIQDGKDNDCDGLIDEGFTTPNPPPGPFNPPSLNANLSGHWSFDILNGSTSTFARDTLGLNNGTATNAQQVYSEVKGEAYKFTGNGFVNISSLNSIGKTQSWWYKSNTTGIWTHYLNSSGTLYVNGVAQSFDNNIISLSNNVFFGININGSIDEIAIWNRTLTATEADEIEHYYRDNAEFLCPNGKVELGEECDDNNTNTTDGCSNNCTINPGRTCITNPLGLSICPPINPPTPSCSDECIKGQVIFRCSLKDIMKRTCADIDGDNCTEWGTPVLNKTCTSNQYCYVPSDSIYAQCVEIESQPVTSCSNNTDSSTCASCSKSIAKSEINNLLFKTSGYSIMPPGGFCDTGKPVKYTAERTPAGLCNLYVNNCTCLWNSTNLTCKTAYSSSTRCDNGGVKTSYSGECSYTTSSLENRCSTLGTIKATRTATWTVTYNPDNLPASQTIPLEGTCVDSILTYACAKTARLPFFTFSNMIVAILAIAGFYFIILRRRQ